MTVNEIKEDLQKVNQQIRKNLDEIKKNNSNGEQMDYCTHPSITNEIDTLLSLAEKIDKIWYQK